MIKRALAIFICTFSVLTQLFAGGGSEIGTETLNVVATTSIIGDVVSNIGGDVIALTILIERGQDPHSFQATPSVLSAIETADLIFVNGFDLEESLLEDINAVAKSPVVAVSEGIEPHSIEHDDGHGHEDGAPNPHVWFDPTSILIWAENIEKHLSAADPVNGDGYHSRAAQYRARLADLDKSIRQRVALIPVSYTHLRAHET